MVPGMKRILLTGAALLAGLVSTAQVPIETPDLYPTYITPNRFGPYAFPVPTQLQARTVGRLQLEVAGDIAVGSLAGSDSRDYTYAPSFKVVVPLWSDRVNLSLWGEMYEWYRDNEKVRALRRVDSKHPLSGGDAGQLFFSLDMLLLREGRLRPSVAARMATLTACGDKYEVARHFDAPGYFFDLSVGKSLNLGRNVSLRASATAGFVCWQIDRGRQNDVWMIGGALSCETPLCTVSVEAAGCRGREKFEDAPSSLQARAAFHIGRFSPFVNYQHGLHDYPFDIFRAGLTVEFDILKSE